jgi:hypothetical protein
MRSTVFALSLAWACCCGLSLAHADEPGRLSGGPFSVPDDGVAEDEAGVADLCDEIPWYEEFVTPRQWFDVPDYGFYGQADALWLARVHNVERPLVVQIPSNAPVLSAQDASLTNRYDLGVLATIGYQLDKVAATELTFFGFHDWDSSASVTDPTGNLHLAGTLSPFTNDFALADQVTITYSSRLYNAEANYKQTIEGLTLLAGFRWFYLTEQFDLNSHSAIFNESSDYTVRARNHLLGGQIGAGYNCQVGRLNLSALGKIGVFANLASNDALLRDFGNTQIIRDYRAETTPVSVLGEIGVNATFWVTDCIALRAGYRLIGVNNLALGPSQLDLTGPAVGRPPFIYAHDYLILHGANAGIEIRF